MSCVNSRGFPHLPASTRIKPRLTPLAAAGLIVVMLLASTFHIGRGQAGAVPLNVVLGALAAWSWRASNFHLLDKERPLRVDRPAR